MKRIISIIAAVIAALISAACGKKASADILAVSFIDVGKGDCILVECGGSTLMIDAGYEETADTVLGFLADKGIQSLDHMIITHYDKDHAGGAAAVAKEIMVSHIYLPNYEEGGSCYKDLKKAISKRDIGSSVVDADTEFSVGSCSVTVYSSDVKYKSGGSGKEGNDNDVSLVVSALHGKDSYLFAGDIEKEGIKSFLNKSDRAYDVLKMPHHGRKDSNTDKLIKVVAPNIAVITDSSGEPADKKTLSLLEDVSVYRSSLNGNIVIESGGNGKYKVVTSK